jgi:hypothetical protein
VSEGGARVVKGWNECMVMFATWTIAEQGPANYTWPRATHADMFEVYWCPHLQHKVGEDSAYAVGVTANP